MNELIKYKKNYQNDIGIKENKGDGGKKDDGGG